MAVGTPTKNFEDLNGHGVAVKGGTLIEEYANKPGGAIWLQGGNLWPTLAVFMAVTGSRCVAFFDDPLVIEDYVRRSSVLLQMVDSTANEGADNGFLVFDTDKSEQVEKFNVGLANIKANGVHDEILTKYLGD